VKVSTYRPSELGAAELARWRLLQEQDERFGHPFLAPDYTLALSRHRPDVYVAVLEQGTELAGFFAFERRRFGVGRALSLADRQGVVHAPSASWSAGELLRGCGLAVLEFDRLMACQAPLLRPQHWSRAVSPVIDVPQDFERWLDAKRRLSRSRIKRTLEHRRQLARDHGDLRFELTSRDAGHLGLLMRWKSAQYHRTGEIDRFAQPWIRDVVEDLFEGAEPNLGVHLSVLSVDARPISLCLSLQAHGVLSVWFPTYDSSLAKYSPGLLCMFELVQAARSHGLRAIDLGRGTEPYKQTLKTRDAWVAEGWAERATATALARRLQRAPRRHARRFVLSHPRLERSARQGLKQIRRFGG
jgi:CelD/BcsL family acetyltransferase involved in cellulose biosynthesis